MPRGFRSFRSWLISLLAAATFAAAAHADTFPSKTIRIIVPYAPGGSIDLTARVVAKNLQQSLGQAVIVENKPGANGVLGIDDLMHSDPDGHTLIILSNSPVTVNPYLSKVSYDPLTDLSPIGRVVDSPIIFAANPKAGIASISDLVTAAKAKPLNYAVSYIGSFAYLSAELLKHDLGIAMQAVPYRGGAPVAAAIASGEVPVGMLDTAAIMPMIANGQVIALGITEPERVRSIPNIPTLREAGVPNFSTSSWLAMFAPRGTPDDRIAKLNAEITKIVAMPDAKEVLLAAGLEPAPSGPDEMRRVIAAEYAMWGQMIAATGLKAE
jgi:tripartite-type tricarboxylate transporter receptor subunit TctC